MKGWIALDIDGTITTDKYSVPKGVVDYLRSLSQEGWQIAVATGRPFTFASYALSQFDFPYLFSAQNGSVVLEMPEKKVLLKKYLTLQAIPVLEKVYKGLGTDFIVYAGYEVGDFCYFRPERLSQEDLEYLEDLQKRQKEPWRAVRQFEMAAFPLIKCFGKAERLEGIAAQLRKTDLFEIAKIRDPFAPEISNLLITDRKASKGLSLKEAFRLKGRGERVIAAGDDENDLSLFEVADFKIAMPHAPEPVRSFADLIAPPTSEQGIIPALKQALSR